MATGAVDAGVKWPNDVWVNKKKLAGILTDSTIMGSSVLALVGVGVRALSPSFLLSLLFSLFLSVSVSFSLFLSPSPYHLLLDPLPVSLPFLTPFYPAPCLI